MSTYIPGGHSRTKSAISELNCGKVRKRHLKAKLNRNVRNMIGRAGLRHAKQVKRQENKGR